MKLPRRKWNFDRPAITRAKRKLGISKPVRFRSTSSLDIYEGYHLWEEGKHIVLMAKGMGSKLANQIIWHELTHALQLERDYGCDWQAWDRDYQVGMIDLGCFEFEDEDQDEWRPTVLPGEIGYRDWLSVYAQHPMEAEALKNERYLAWRYPLVKSAVAR
jgi:hypothetical protein